VVKQQQLFNSFCLASTTAVLATQPAWADTVQVSAVRLNPTVSGIEVILKTPKSASPPVSTFSFGETFVADIANTQLRLRKDDTFRASNPTDRITAVPVMPLNAKSIRVTVIGKAGVPVAKVVHSDKGLVLSFKASDKVSSQSRSNPASDKRNSHVSQSPSPNPTSPTSPQLPTSDIPTQPTPAPRYLNPNPNPLQFPTRPEEVRIQGTQPITLQQAFELARRNNRTLQSAELTLERDRAALREAEAALYPRVNATAQIANSGPAFIYNPRSISQTGQGITTPTGTNGTTTPTGTNGGTTTPTGTNGTTIPTGTNGTTTTPAGTTPGSTSPGLTTSQAVTTPATTTTRGATSSGTSSGGTSATPSISPVVNTPASTIPASTSGGGTSRGGANVGGTGQTGTSGTGTSGTGTSGTGTSRTGTSSGSSSLGRYSSTDLTGTLALSYNLYTSGGRKASIRAAEQQVRYDQLGVEIASQQVRLDVSTYYYNLQSADQQVLIYQAAVTNAQSSLRDAQAQERAGVGTRFDTLRAQVQLANSVQNLTTSQANQQTARRQLAQYLSIAQTVDLSAADPVQIAGLWNFSLEDSIVLAFKNRAELVQYLAQRNIYEQNRRLALSNLGPQVGLFANYNLNDNLTNSIRGIAGRIGNSDNYSVGAQVSLLLFDGGQYRAAAQQAEANKAIAQVSFANERNLIRFDVENYFAQLQANLANIQLSSVAVEQSREELRLARLRFQAGVGTQTDVISAENDLTNAEGSRVSAILNYNKSLASLQRSVSSGHPL